MRMKPIFLLLTIVAFGVMGHTFMLGWRFHARRPELRAREERGEAVSEAEKDAVSGLLLSHFVWGGVFSGVAVILVHSLVLTYFLGTGKAIKEQMELQQWGDAEYLAWKRLMARAVFPSSAGIVAIFLMMISGGFALRASISPATHLAIILGGAAIQVPVFLAQWALIHANGKIMDGIIEKLGGEQVRLAL